MMSIKIKNDFDGSNPTAEMPKISFSCGLDTPAVRNSRIVSFSFIAAKMPAAEASQLSIISDLLRKQNPCINYHYMHIYVGYRLFLRLYDL